MKKLSLLLVSLSLASCAGLPQIGLPVAPTAVQQKLCNFEDQLETTWKVFNFSLDLLNALGDAGKIVPGTPRGKAVASGIRTVNAALGRAERFAITCDEREIKAALTDAKAGIDDLSIVVKGE